MPNNFTDVKTLFLNNKEVKSIVIDETDGGIIYEKTTTLIATNLIIEAPALVYSDAFDVTGLLTDDNNNPISGASVKLYRDNDILEATETTDSNGEVIFHRNAPTSITSYDFQLKYDGDTYHNSSNSSIVTRVVNKETSILNLISPLDESTYINDGSKIFVKGNLSDNDGTPLENKNIQIKKNNNLITTLTTNEEGDFIRGIPLEFLNIGRNELDFIFNEEEYYTGSTQTVIINVETTPTNLTIEVPALIYSDVFYITGILTDENSDGIAGANVKLIRDGNILEATDTTDLNGEVTFRRNAPTEIETYTFQLIFEGDETYNNSSSSIVSRTVGKETSILNITSPLNNSNINEGDDLIITGNLNDNDATPIANKTVVVKYEFEFVSSTEYHVTGARYVQIEPDFSFQNGDWELTFNFKGAHNGEQFGVGDASSPNSPKCFASSVKQGNNYYLTGLQGLTEETEIWHRSSFYMNTSTYYPMKIRKEGTTLYYYFNGNLMDTVTSNEFANVESLSFFIRTYYSDDTQGVYVKDIKLKMI